MYFPCSKKISEFLLISVMFTEAGLIQGTFFKENTYTFTYLDKFEHLLSGNLDPDQ